MSRPRNRPRLLIISFSPITADARVLKQVSLFSREYDVTTCGFGPRPEGVVGHIEVPSGLTAAKPYSRLLELRMFKFAYWRQTAVRWAHSALRGGTWEAVIANDPESLPLAFKLSPPARIHVDLHEYSPRMREHLANWSQVYGPYYQWLIGRYARRAASATTVSRGIAEEYWSQFGFRAGLVTNAAPYAPLAPTKVGEPLRLVHSGAALPHRGLDVIVEAVARTRANVTLDLYLVPSSPAVIEDLRLRAGSRVTIHPPVPYPSLASTLNQHDVGLHLLEPVNFNHANALPNKIFDYVQARLALVVGPTPEMAALVDEHSLGWVSPGFTVEDLVGVLDALTVTDVDRAKHASHVAAKTLAAERQVLGWREAVGAIVSRRFS